MQTLISDLRVAKNQLEPAHSDFRIAFEDEEGGRDCTRIVTPDPNFLAMAMKGGIVPSVQAYHQATYRLTVQFPNELPISAIITGLKKDAAKRDAINRGAVVLAEVVVSPDWFDAERMPALSEAEAIEYIIQKDIDYSVWGAPSNRQRFKVITADDLPTDRNARNSWELV